MGQADYWKRTSEENFKEWMNYKTSICLPVNNDMPIRMFDALAVGQIPLVPAWIDGLDHVISLADQDRLPIVKFYDNTIEEIGRAYERAIQLFDAGGPDGAAERSAYCVQNHTFSRRYEEILCKVLQYIRAMV